MAKIVWTDEAIQWLEDIHDYIAAERPNAALRVVNGIYDKVQLLAEFPRLGERYMAIENREIRVTLYGHYRIAYLIRNETRIEILGIFHAAMEIERYLH
ncbi:MAG: type II toxin-antitoxin system RelE/ParE family toxin [Planctomycetales bacterium]|nr:type II toxin-antitoxin system RelE/ParE family toxin [Planctomycetales bacterium]